MPEIPITYNTNLRELRLKYAITKKYYDGLARRLKGKKGIPATVFLLIFFVYSILFFCIPMLFIFWPGFIILTGWVSYVILGGIYSSNKEAKDLKMQKIQISNELNQIKNEISKLIITNNVELYKPININNYVSIIDFKKEVKFHFDEQLKKYIFINFYAIPECFKRYKNIIYDIEIYEEKGPPILIENENIIMQRDDINLSLYCVNNNGRRGFVKSSETGVLYLTNFRLIYIRNPSRDYPCHSKLFYRELENWKNFERYECISVPNIYFTNLRISTSSNEKEFSIPIKYMDACFRIELSSKDSITSLIKVFNETMDGI